MRTADKRSSGSSIDGASVRTRNAADLLGMLLVVKAADAEVTAPTAATPASVGTVAPPPPTVRLPAGTTAQGPAGTSGTTPGATGETTPATEVTTPPEVDSVT